MNQENRFIYRIKYTKGEMVKYISHLDFLRCVNRSFKRGKIPVKYSNGFNPHVLLNIALPCPVGVSSICELLDIELYEKMDCKEIKKRLGASLPVGIEALEVWERGNSPDFFEISSALYDASFSSDKEIDIGKFIAEPIVMTEKKSKRGMKEVNIKDFVRDMQIVSADNKSYKLTMTIDAGAKSNLKPELLLNSMAKYFEAEFKDIKVERKEIYFACK